MAQTNYKNRTNLYTRHIICDMFGFIQLFLLVANIQMNQLILNSIMSVNWILLQIRPNLALIWARTLCCVYQQNVVRDCYMIKKT